MVINCVFLTIGLADRSIKLARDVDEWSKEFSINYQLQESADLGVNEAWRNLENTLIFSTDQGVTKLVTLRGVEAITADKKFYHLHFFDTE